MTEPRTTEGLPIPDALELIVKWMREGRKIEYQQVGDKWAIADAAMSGSPNVMARIYRAKPRKPRITEIFEDRFSKAQIINIDNIVEVVELTPEVRAVLEREGLI